MPDLPRLYTELGTSSDTFHPTFFVFTCQSSDMYI